MIFHHLKILLTSHYVIIITEKEYSKRDFQKHQRNHQRQDKSLQIINLLGLTRSESGTTCTTSFLLILMDINADRLKFDT